MKEKEMKMLKELSEKHNQEVSKKIAELEKECLAELDAVLKKHRFNLKITQPKIYLEKVE